MAEKPRILLVDDERALVQLVSLRLESAGYDVVAAYDGQQGLDDVRQRRPALIILDVMLPEIDGYTVCKRLKQDPRYQTIPIILLTAKAQRQDERLGYTVGADAYLRKPCDSVTLLEQVRALLAAPLPGALSPAAPGQVGGGTCPGPLRQDHLPTA